VFLTAPGVAVGIKLARQQRLRGRENVNPHISRDAVGGLELGQLALDGIEHVAQRRSLPRVREEGGREADEGAHDLLARLRRERERLDE
jgi:hypothetical protein